MSILGIVRKVFPAVGRIMMVVEEAREAVGAGQEFAAEVERTLEGDHPLKKKAEAMMAEFKDLERAINDVI
jgi:hypothetical protein